MSVNGSSHEGCADLRHGSTEELHTLTHERSKYSKCIHVRHLGAPRSVSGQQLQHAPERPSFAAYFPLVT